MQLLTHGIALRIRLDAFQLVQVRVEVDDDPSQGKRAVPFAVDVGLVHEAHELDALVHVG